MQKNTKSKGSKTLDVMTFKMGQPSLIEASAGTGKTYTITNLVLRALLGVGKKEYSLERPLEIDELLIVTFTNAATSDLRQRVYERIRAARHCIEEFINFVLFFINSGDDLEGSLLVNDLAAIKRKHLIKVKSKQDNEALSNSYSEQELQDLLLEINVDAALEQIGVKDEIFVAIIKELLDRNIVPLRQAALILVRAERKINQAAISTIHSFCNSTLTQIYALESGEAFNTELKTDLSDVNHEAWYQVWRRLFYQSNSSQLLLDSLGSGNPECLTEMIRKLQSVRLSSASKGFYGYELYEFDDYLKTNGCSIDKSQALEPQLHAYIRDLGEAKVRYGELLAMLSLDLYKNLDEQVLAQYYDENTGEAGPKFTGGKSAAKILAGAKAHLSYLYTFLRTIKELKALQEMGVDTSSLEYGKQLYKLVAAYQKLDSANFTAEKILFKASLKNAGYVATCEELTGLLGAFFTQVQESAGPLGTMLSKCNTILSVLVAILMIQETELKCKELHVMSTDDVLHRLDYALNERDKLGDNLAWAIRARYPLAMIDEFQDTDPVQFNIFTKIYLNAEALEQKAYCYLIGDPKQSIYAFRGSDINSYLKARDCIKRLTNSQGLYTLDTNYRSSPDVVEATNALFDSSLNEANINPFNEANIRFNPVYSGKGKQLLKKLNGQEQGEPLERDFVLEGVDNYVIDSKSTSSESEVPNTDNQNSIAADGAGVNKLKFKSYANTYIVDVGNDYSGVGPMRNAFAKSAALLVKKILEQGYIIKDGQRHHVKSGDIAILVRSAAQNDLMQQELWNLQIPSVYFSDTSSVLTDSEGNPTKEALELRYLMEAMCDTTNRSKVNRLLACSMLSLSTEEFNEFTGDESFEKEVKILNNCAKTWGSSGFMPAFLQWASDDRHNMAARLLELKDGERAYTNYCHISEIIQGVHNKKVGMQAQLHWFTTVLTQIGENEYVDETKKRLESEQDQVKILTIHKSKGLEFPVVLSPFLWNFVKEQNLSNDSVRYYVADEPYSHVVMDFEPGRMLNITKAMPVVDANHQDTGKNIKHDFKLKASDIQKDEDGKEDTRVLYVAITRARYANFFFVGQSKLASNYKISSFPSMQGNHELKNVCSENNELIGSSNSRDVNASLFIESVLQRPEEFTLLDGLKLIEESELINRQANAIEYEPLPYTCSDEELGEFKRNALQVSSMPKSMKTPNIAQSFLYKGAIDTSFNIVSFSSLIENKKGSNKFEDADFAVVEKDSCDDSDITSTTSLGKEDGAKSDKIEQDAVSLEFSWSYQVQKAWQQMREQTDFPLCYSFKTGATAGTFMHAVLEHIDFEKHKREGYLPYLNQQVMAKVIDNSRYSGLVKSAGKDRLERQNRLAQWFNDVLEAPIVQGKYHCLALADLLAGSYEREMRFLMSSKHFKLTDLDEICRKVAKKLLPKHLQDAVGVLSLNGSDVQGYITGSIDLACSFDLNTSLQLRERPDLQHALAPKVCHKLSTLLNNSRCHKLTARTNLSKYDLELFTNASFEHLAKLRAQQDGHNLKYYVIDYKSNFLGTSDNSYEYPQLLKAIYSHRYDLQFMIYTLALYRHLLRRFAMPFDAPKEQLAQFYEQHVGGVLYLFLRGMKANYLRNSISPGVFSTKIDFEVVYELDQLFS